jgi:hypothetical protein
MVKSLRAYSSRNVIVWDVLNAVDISIRAQAFPMVLRDLFKYLFSCGSLTALLRTQYNDVKVHCLSVSQDIHSQALYRDVDVIANTQSIWRARTIIPESTRRYLANYFQLDRHFSIGDFLFCSPMVKRKSLHLSIQFYVPLFMSNKRQWYFVRESVWVIHDLFELIVMEFF